MHWNNQEDGGWAWTRYKKVTISSFSLAEELLIKETLDVRAIQKILGKRPFPPNKTF